MKFLKLFLILFFFMLCFSVVSAKVYKIDFVDDYQDYLGNYHKFTKENIVNYPFYRIIENGNNYTIIRFGEMVILPKRSWISYDFQATRIIPTYIINNFTQINSLVTKVNSTAWYLTFPFSASQYKTVTDDLIDMNIFFRTNKYTIWDSNLSEDKINDYMMYPKVISGNIRIYFNPRNYSNVVYPLYIQEQTIYVNNSTTSGWTSGVILNGTMWNGNGAIRLHLNATYLDGAVAFYPLDETTGILMHNFNQANGLMNATNQGTWNGDIDVNSTFEKIGNALSFDGVDDYVNCGNDESLNFSSNYTILMRVNYTGSGTANTQIISREGNRLGDYTYNVYNTTGALRMLRWYNVFNVARATTTNKLIFNQSSFIAFKFNNSLVGYINNTISVPINDTTSSNTSNANTFLGYRAGTSNYLRGSIDEVLISNRAWSDSDVSNFYTSPLRASGNISTNGSDLGAGYQGSTLLYLANNVDSNLTVDLYVSADNTIWYLVQSSASNNTAYNIPTAAKNETQYVRAQLNGNQSNTPFLYEMQVESEPIPSLPSFSSWYNNYTSDNTLIFDTSKYRNIDFGFTSNQSVYVNWFVDDINQSIYGNNLTFNFTDNHRYNVSAIIINQSNSSLSNIKTWLVSIPTINFTGWQNNFTFNRNTSITLYQYTNTIFNITTNQTANYTWFVDNIIQNNETYDNFTANFTQLKVYEIKIIANNINDTKELIFYVTTTFLPQSPQTVYGKIGSQTVRIYIFGGQLNFTDLESTYNIEGEREMSFWTSITLPFLVILGHFVFTIYLMQKQRYMVIVTTGLMVIQSFLIMLYLIGTMDRIIDMYIVFFGSTLLSLMDIALREL